MSAPESALPEKHREASPGPREVFRTFWVGPVGPYQHLCWRSFLRFGHAVEVFTYDEALSVPDGVRLRDAREILPDEEPADAPPCRLRDLFRYAMLDRLGGWWVEPDVAILRDELPTGVFFLAAEGACLVSPAVVKAPPGHELFRLAARMAGDAGRAAPPHQTGALLLTRLVHELRLGSQVGDPAAVHEIRRDELWKLFAPERRAEVERRLRFAPFGQLSIDAWTEHGLEAGLAPPRGSFLDGLCRRLEVLALFTGRMSLDVATTLTGFGALQNAEHRPLAVIDGFRSTILDAADTLDDPAPVPHQAPAGAALGRIWRAAERVEAAANQLARVAKIHDPERWLQTVGAPRPAPAPAAPPHTFRCFWHGSQLSPYERLSIASLRSRGHRVVLYRYDGTIAAPDGVEVADAREILPTQTVLTHETGRGAGSFALHCDILRLMLLEKYGDWYLDLDMVLLDAPLPEDPFVFFFHEEGDPTVNSAASRAPAGAVFLRETIEAIDLDTAPQVGWGELGPALVTNMLEAHGLTSRVRPRQQAFPLHWSEFEKLFLPEHCAEVELRCAESIFLHFWHDRLRRCGVPKWIRPPRGSYMDLLFDRFGIGFPDEIALEADHVARWAVNLREREALERRVAAETRANLPGRTAATIVAGANTASSGLWGAPGR